MSMKRRCQYQPLWPRPFVLANCSFVSRSACAFVHDYFHTNVAKCSCVMRTGLEHACAYVVCVHDKTCTDGPRVVFRVPAIAAAALCALVLVAAALSALELLVAALITVLFANVFLLTHDVVDCSRTPLRPRPIRQ